MLLCVEGKLWVKCGSGFLGSRTTELVGAPDSQARCAAGQAVAACTWGAGGWALVTQTEVDPRGEAQEQAAWLPECRRPERLGWAFRGGGQPQQGVPRPCVCACCFAQLAFTASCHEDPPFLPWPHVCVVPSGQLSGHDKVRCPCGIRTPTPCPDAARCYGLTPFDLPTLLSVACPAAGPGVRSAGVSA